MGKGGQQRRKLLRDQADYAIRHGLAEREILSEKDAFTLFWAIHNNKASIFSITRLSKIDVRRPYLLPKKLRLGWIERICFLAYAALSRRTGIILQLLRAGCSVDQLFERSFCNAVADKTTSSTVTEAPPECRQKINAFMNTLPLPTQAWVVYEIVGMCSGFQWIGTEAHFRREQAECAQCSTLVDHPFEWGSGCLKFDPSQRSVAAQRAAARAAAAAVVKAKKARPLAAIVKATPVPAAASAAEAAASACDSAPTSPDQAFGLRGSQPVFGSPVLHTPERRRNAFDSRDAHGLQWSYNSNENTPTQYGGNVFINSPMFPKSYRAGFGEDSPSIHFQPNAASPGLPLGANNLLAQGRSPAANSPMPVLLTPTRIEVSLPSCIGHSGWHVMASRTSA